MNEEPDEETPEAQLLELLESEQGGWSVPPFWCGLPSSFLRAHAADVLKNAYYCYCEAISYGNGRHVETWKTVVEEVAKVDREAVMSFVEHTLLPEIKEAAEKFAKECETAPWGEEPPNLERTPLLDIAAMIRDMTAVDSKLLAPPSAICLAAALRPHWEALLRYNTYPCWNLCEDFEKLQKLIGNIVEEKARVEGLVRCVFNVPRYTFAATVLFGAKAPPQLASQAADDGDGGDSSASSRPRLCDNRGSVLSLLLRLDRGLCEQTKRLIWAYAGVRGGPEWRAIEAAASELHVDLNVISTPPSSSLSSPALAAAQAKFSIGDCVTCPQGEDCTVAGFDENGGVLVEYEIFTRRFSHKSLLTKAEAVATGAAAEARAVAAANAKFSVGDRVKWTTSSGLRREDAEWTVGTVVEIKDGGEVLVRFKAASGGYDFDEVTHEDLVVEATATTIAAAGGLAAYQLGKYRLY